MSDEIKDMLKKQEAMMQQLINMVGKNNERFNDLEKRFDKVDQRLESIEASVQRIEMNEPADIMAMLKQINGKLDDRDNDMQALNKRVFKVESEIERLTRQ